MTAVWLQASWKVYPIRGKMCGRTLRSSSWRSSAETLTLDRYTRHIVAIQLQGNIFFGNATLLAEEVEKLLTQPQPSSHVWFVVLDFTLVVGIDSSAAETILKIYKLCRHHNVRLCYCAGAETGFPCSFPLSDSINDLNAETVKAKLGSCVRCGASSSLFTAGKCIACGRNDAFMRPKWVCTASSLDNALRWCEDVILSEAQSGTRPGCVYGSIRSIATTATTATMATMSSVNAAVVPSPAVSPRTLSRDTGTQLSPTPCVTPISADVPMYLHQIYLLLRCEPRQKIEQLLGYFVTDFVDRGKVLWVQGGVSDRALVLVSGRLQHSLEEEADTIEMVYPGHLVGEYGLLNDQIRTGTLTAIEDCEVLVLSQESFQAMQRNDPYLALMFAKICMASTPILCVHHGCQRFLTAG